jgi:hypothetical protein
MEIRLHCINILTEHEEAPKGCKCPVETHRFDFRLCLPPRLVPHQIPTPDVIHVIDIGVIGPLDEDPER